MEHCLALFKKPAVLLLFMVQNENAKPGPQYLEKFKRFETEPGQPAWMLPLRRAGIASFMDQGFPTLHDEDWRYTNVARNVDYSARTSGNHVGHDSAAAEETSLQADLDVSPP